MHPSGTRIWGVSHTVRIAPLTTCRPTFPEAPNTTTVLVGGMLDPYVVRISWRDRVETALALHRIHVST